MKGKVPSLAGYVHFHISKLLKANSVKSVVDVGGTGRLGWFMEHVKNANIKNGIDGTNLPFGNNSFDAAISIATLEHVDNQRKFLSESARVAKKMTVHWFPMGEGAKLVEKFKVRTGYRHPCILPRISMVQAFCQTITNAAIYPFISVREHVLCLDLKNKARFESFKLVEEHGHKPYGFMVCGIL